MDDLERQFGFIGYIVVRPDDDNFAETSSGVYVYRHKLPLAKNIFVADYSDGEFFYTLYDAYDVDFYSKITELPALIRLNISEPNKSEVMYGRDIIEMCPIFEPDDINEYYFKSDDDEANILRYFEDAAGRIQSLGFSPLKRG